MPGMSIHVVDVTRGLVAAGMQVEVHALQPMGLLCAGAISARGTLEDDRLAARVARGAYEARFHVAAWYRAAGVSLPAIPFLDVALFRFGIDDADQHYHLPMKVTPWGLSCFRGGA